MGLQMSPAKMVVAKVISHKDKDRHVTLALENFGLFEFIDVRKKSHLATVERTREESTALAALERLERLADTFDIDLQRGSADRVSIDDTSISNAIEYASNVIKGVEPEVLEIDQKLVSLQMELERLMNIRDIAQYLEPLGLDPSYIGSTEFTYTTAGVISTSKFSELKWSLNEVTDGSYAVNSINLKRGVTVAIVSVPVSMRSGVERILTALGFESFSIPEGSEGSPEKILSESTNRISEIEQEITRLRQRKNHLRKDWTRRISAAWELMTIERKRLDARRFYVYTEESVKTWGWIPKGKETELESLLKEHIGTAYVLEIDEPDFVETESPTYLDNPEFMKPTQEVVEAFGTPSKHDLDPTKIMWLSFPLIFGLVFADVGQGFLILLIGLAAWRSKKKGDDWGSMLGYLQAGAEGLIMMGIFAMIGGFLFGSFFGAETVIEPLWPTFAHLDEHGHHNPYRAVHMLKLSIEVGAIQIALGIILSIYNHIKHHEMRKAAISASYLWLYFGFINLLFGVSYNSIEQWFNPDKLMNMWLPIVGIGYGSGNNGIYPVLPISAQVFTMIMLIVPLVIMTLSSVVGGMDGMVHLMESVLGMISHTVSYARIFALNTVHVILSGVFITLLPPLLVIPFPHIELLGVEIIPETVWHEGPHGPEQVQPFLPLLGAVVGTLIVGILEGLLAFMHTLRLHFVEWFSKFYHAGGIPFDPFTIKRIHTTVPRMETEVPTQSGYAVN
ncbi:MAG: V-type ATP synthase subunit I [Candidatus Thorarchaeota archaeon]|nr:MAG: V-type ATP synthase subunit I [Candidatus Thorarchaeota archaeon]